MKEKLTMAEWESYQNIVVGRLKCINCIYNENCNEINENCVANYIYDDEVVHIKEMEVSNEVYDE